MDAPFHSHSLASASQRIFSIPSFTNTNQNEFNEEPKDTRNSSYNDQIIIQKSNGIVNSSTSTLIDLIDVDRMQRAWESQPEV